MDSGVRGFIRINILGLCKLRCDEFYSRPHLFLNRAHLALNDGASFGSGGEGFMRLNIALSRTVLEQALQQLADALALA